MTEIKKVRLGISRITAILKQKGNISVIPKKVFEEDEEYANDRNGHRELAQHPEHKGEEGRVA